MCSLFANIYMLLTWGPHTVCHGDPIHIFNIYMIKCGWLGSGAGYGLRLVTLARGTREGNKLVALARGTG